MTNEEKRNDAIDRLGGESRLSKLERRIEHLEGLLQEIHLRPGVKLTNLLASGLSWFDGTIYAATPLTSGDVVLVAIGDDWCVIRDSVGSTFCAIEPDVHTALRSCL